jgi:two-component system response regulator YesN
VDPRIEIVVKIIGEQKGEIHLTLKVSSQLLGVTEAYLLRLFKQEVGTTFLRYLRKQRMSRAAELVSDPSVAIKRIALISGYSDVSNFYRDFKQVHGMSPRKFRGEQLTLQSEELLRRYPNTPRGTLRSNRLET